MASKREIISGHACYGVCLRNDNGGEHGLINLVPVGDYIENKSNEEADLLAKRAALGKANMWRNNYYNDEAKSVFVVKLRGSRSNFYNNEGLKDLPEVY